MRLLIMPDRFESKKFPGLIMNQHGCVRDLTLSPSELVTDTLLRGFVIREAIVAGWRKEPSPDRDVGLLWVPPK